VVIDEDKLGRQAGGEQVVRVKNLARGDAQPQVPLADVARYMQVGGRGLLARAAGGWAAGWALLPACWLGHWLGLAGCGLRQPAGRRGGA
jgi:hypothetical protein